MVSQPEKNNLPGTSVPVARQAGSSQGEATRLNLFEPKQRQPENGEEENHDRSPFVEQHHGRKSGVGTGIDAMECSTHVPEQTQNVDDTEGSHSNPLFDVKRDRNQDNEIKGNHAHSDPEGTVRRYKRNQDLQYRIWKITVKQ
jgi:hypothetical protein